MSADPPRPPETLAPETLDMIEQTLDAYCFASVRPEAGRELLEQKRDGYRQMMAAVRETLDAQRAALATVTQERDQWRSLTITPLGAEHYIQRAEAAEADLAKALAALAQQWQPLETCPRGVDVLVRDANHCGHGPRVHVSRISRYETVRPFGGPPPTVTWEFSGVSEPTGWMPLPALTADAAARSGKE